MVGGPVDYQAKSPVPQWLLNFSGTDFSHDVVFVNLVVPRENPNVSDDALAYLPLLPHLRGLFLITYAARKSRRKA